MEGRDLVEIESHNGAVPLDVSGAILMANIIIRMMKNRVKYAESTVVGQGALNTAIKEVQLLEKKVEKGGIEALLNAMREHSGS